MLGPQVVPHPPQLLLSVCVSVQMPPHTVNPEPGGQELVHTPPWQACPAAHVLPQAPQLAVPVCKTQEPLHIIWYGGQPLLTPPPLAPPLVVPLLAVPLLAVPPLLMPPLLTPPLPEPDAPPSCPPPLGPLAFPCEPPQAANTVAATTTPVANVRAIPRMPSSACASRQRNERAPLESAK
jgi:hypothetical protein